VLLRAGDRWKGHGSARKHDDVFTSTSIALLSCQWARISLAVQQKTFPLQMPGDRAVEQNTP
jgi:hypothetical protein